MQEGTSRRRENKRNGATALLIDKPCSNPIEAVNMEPQSNVHQLQSFSNTARPHLDPQPSTHQQLHFLFEDNHSHSTIIMEVSPHHPTPHPNTHHRRIELQSPLDLNFLQNNLYTSSQQKLDLHFPPSALRKPPAQPATFISLDGKQDASSQPAPQTLLQQQQQELDDDPLRSRVQTLITSFLTRTWSSASHSISINGLDASSLPNTTFPAAPQHPSTQEPVGEREGVDFTYSPYDSRLQSQVASLYGELEALTAQVSKLRREAPSNGAQRCSEKLREQMQEEEEDFEREMQSLREQQEVEQKGQGKQEDVLRLEKPRQGYHEDMRDTYARGVEDLARLAGVGSRYDSAGVSSAGQAGGSLTETVGKVQRARTVAMEFE